MRSEYKPRKVGISCVLFTVASPAQHLHIVGTQQILVEGRGCEFVAGFFWNL